jgi:hypothetical protein
MLSKTFRNRSWDSLRDFSASLLFLPAWFLQPHLPVCSHLQAEPPVSFIKMLPAHDLCGAETGQGKAGPQPYRAGPAHCGQDQCQANQIQPNANGQGQADGKGVRRWARTRFGPSRPPGPGRWPQASESDPAKCQLRS